MSEFCVSIETIAEIHPHPNADRLELATLDRLDFSFVVQKGLYQQGDEVFYFPVDSVIPADLQAVLGIEGRLSGSLKNRLKTVKLRGAISQGLVAPKAELVQAFRDRLMEAELAVESGLETDSHGITHDAFSQIDFTKVFGITKYEPVLSGKGGVNCGGRQRTLPDGISYYDLESAQRNKAAVQFLIDNDVKVLITEKLEGTNLAIQKLVSTGEVQVCSRNHQYQRMFNPDGTPQSNTWLDTVEANPWTITLLDQLAEAFDAVHSVALRGEIIGPGVQGNIYKLFQNQIRVFELMVDGEYIAPNDFPSFMLKDCENPVFAPRLFVGTIKVFLQKERCDTLVQASDGVSQLAHTLREGIVIRPFDEEMTFPGLGRLILKVRSPNYLAKGDN